jgi:hypothetical protein
MLFPELALNHDPPTSASWVARITGMCHNTQVLAIDLSSPRTCKHTLILGAGSGDGGVPLVSIGSLCWLIFHPKSPHIFWGLLAAKTSFCLSGPGAKSLPTRTTPVLHPTQHKRSRMKIPLARCSTLSMPVAASEHPHFTWVPWPWTWSCSNTASTSKARLFWGHFRLWFSLICFHCWFYIICFLLENFFIFLTHSYEIKYFCITRPLWTKWKSKRQTEEKSSQFSS